MRSLDDARRRGRTCRETVDARAEATLRARLEGYIEDVHEFFLEAAGPGDIGTDKAILDNPSLYYAESLESTPADLLLQLAHELGHLEQHPRVKEKQTDAAKRHRSGRVVPLTSAPYVANQETVAVARYSTRSLEEAEATAFAIDFLCPSDEVFAVWREAPGTAIPDIAAQFGVPVEVARAQLAAAVFELATGSTIKSGGGSGSSEREENPQQDRAVVWPEKESFEERKPLLIDAGPGTGKTTTLIRRVVHLLQSGQAKPSEVLVLTFSNEAAAELQARLRAALGPARAQEVMVATFHGFGRHLLHYLGGRFESDLLGSVPVLDPSSQEELVLDLLGRAEAAQTYGALMKLSDLRGTANDAVRHINHLKQRLWSVERLREAIAAESASDKDRRRSLAMTELYAAYEVEKEARGTVDFADLILLPLRLMTEDAHAEAAKSVRAQYPHVLVDEFQDVSEATGQLLRALCKEHPPWVVGDARQAIYRFLGAHPGNVSTFLETYDDAKRIGLAINYRSCQEVVDANNTLASLLDDPELGPDVDRTRWRPKQNPPAGEGNPVVEVVRAESDAAERTGIADHVAAMIHEEGIPSGDIAVLARRNADVRAIALELGERGIEISTAGLVTPEGAAGDLLAAAAARDASKTATPRLAAALGRGRIDPSSINGGIRRLRGNELEVTPEAADFVVEVEMAMDGLRGAAGRPDAFGQMTAFLFEASAFLRRILDAPSGAERSMALSEIAVALSEAGLYRFTHRSQDAASARRGFVAFFERTLREGTPSRIAPGASSGAVRVLTTHASKGLQFPHVIVAGQTMPQRQYWSDRRYSWVPKTVRPSGDEDEGQANALLFVGVSRAQRSARISYAATATTKKGSHVRPLPPLLQQWTTMTDVAQREWPPGDDQREIVETERIWGGALQPTMNAKTFDKGSCTVRTYLDEELGLDLPEADRPLYPAYFSSVRKGIGAVMQRAHESRREVSRSEALEIVSEVWPPTGANEHRHLPMFTHELTEAVTGFAAAYGPLADAHDEVDLDAVEEAMRTPAPGLRVCSAFRDAENRVTVLFVRPESLSDGLAKRGPLQGNLNWSGGNLTTEQIRAFSIREIYPSARLLVYSAADQTIYEWNPPSPPKGDKVATDVRIRGEVSDVQAQFERGRLEHTVSEFMCGRCRKRTVCPIWLELTQT